jgi:hypothetical protein
VVTRAARKQQQQQQLMWGQTACCMLQSLSSCINRMCNSFRRQPALLLLLLQAVHGLCDLQDPSVTHLICVRPCNAQDACRHALSVEQLKN